MWRNVLLCLVLVLSGCSWFPGMREEPAFGRPPLASARDSVIMRRLIGEDMLDQPLLPQPGDIWADVLPTAEPELSAVASHAGEHHPVVVAGALCRGPPPGTPPRPATAPAAAAPIVKAAATAADAPTAATLAAAPPTVAAALAPEPDAPAPADAVGPAVPARAKAAPQAAALTVVAVLAPEPDAPAPAEAVGPVVPARVKAAMAAAAPTGGGAPRTR